MNNDTEKMGRFAGTWLKVMESTGVALVFILPLAFYLRTYDSAAVKTGAFQVGALVLLFSWLLKGLEAGRFEASRRVLPLIAPAGALLAWTVGVFLLSPYKLAALPGFLNQVLSILTFILVVWELGSADYAQRTMDAMLAAAWVACAYGLLQIAGVDPFSWAGSFGERAFSTFGDPDLFAMFLALCVPVALTRVLDPEASTLSRAANGALLPVLGLVLTRTGSAEGAAALAVQAVTFSVVAAALLPMRVALKPMLAAGVLAVAVLAGSGAPVEDNLVKESEFKRHTWAATFKLIEEKPFVGHGPGSFAVHYPRVRPPEVEASDHPESQLLETAAELGWTGASLWLLVFVQVLISAWQASRLFARQGALREAVAAVGLSAAVAGQLLCAQLGIGSQHLMPGWLLWALAGVLGGLITLAKDSPRVVLPMDIRQPARRKLYGPALAVFLAALVMPGLWFKSDLALKNGDFDAVVAGAPGYLTARYYKGNALMNEGRTEEALKEYAALKELSPDYGQVDYKMGEAYAALSDWDNAIASHERYAKLDPLSVQNQLRIAEAARAKGDFAQAHRAALSAIALQPKEPSHWKVLAQIYMKEKHLAAGRKMESKAAKLIRSARDEAQP